MNKNNRTLNGYVLVHRPDHPKSMKGGNWDGYIYEHILIADEELNVRIKEGDEVHHLDENRSNNSPDNLLVLSGPMHVKLHSWLNKNTITPSEEYSKRIERGCVRCGVCNKPIDGSMVYCSVNCSTSKEGREQIHKYIHPDKKTLEKLVWSKPTMEVAKVFNVSDKAIEKLCKNLGVSKPPRGYWAKVNAGLICPME